MMSRTHTCSLWPTSPGGLRLWLGSLSSWTLVLPAAGCVAILRLDTGWLAGLWIFATFILFLYIGARFRPRSVRSSGGAKRASSHDDQAGVGSFFGSLHAGHRVFIDLHSSKHLDLHAASADHGQSDRLDISQRNLSYSTRLTVPPQSDPSLLVRHSRVGIVRSVDG